MQVTYHGHACFSVTASGYTVVLDPFRGVKGFEDINLSANEVRCSHGHFDHCYTEGVQLHPGKSPFAVSAVPCFHDQCGGAKRGENTIHVLEAEGKKIVHLGDLGHLLTKEDASKIAGCDLLMIPVGGFFTIGPEEALQIIKAAAPEQIAPMHYRDGACGLEQIRSIDDFLDLADEEIRSKLVLVRGYNKTVEL